MKLIIDIPDSDYTAVRCEALYYIGHDKLAESVTTAFQTATPYEERPQGKWINESISFGCGDAECSNCHEKAEMIVKDNGWGYDYSSYNFCPNCGADMRGGAV